MAFRVRDHYENWLTSTSLSQPYTHFRRNVKFKNQRRKHKIIKILFLTANPKDTSSLRLDEEVRDIDMALRQAEFRDSFDIKQQRAVRVADLQGSLLRHKPDIVHFSGHGSASSQIFLEDNNGNSHPM